MKENPNIDLGVVGMPVGKARANVLFWGGFGISALSKNQDAAWRFLRYYIGEGRRRKSGRTGRCPPSVAVAESAGLSTDPIEGVLAQRVELTWRRAPISSPPTGVRRLTRRCARCWKRSSSIPNADVAATLATAAQDAQAADDLMRQQ